VKSIILALLLTLTTSFALADTELKIGSAAPDFELVDTAGAKHKLSSYLGKVVVLEWTNPGCPFVKRHYKKGTMKDLASTFSGQGVVWLTINSTHYLKEEELKKWSQESKLAYPVLNDADGKVGRAYGAKTTPHMFIVNKDGKVAYSGAIDSDPYGDESDARNYVNTALKEILSDKPVTVTETTPYGCSVKYKS
jgi:peroxiredoxin